jgi:hypothetical protein
MDEIRCPMCGKPNPADLEICQFCQARLKPLMDASLSQDEESNIPDEGGPLPASSGDQTSMDEWLSFLRESDETGGPRSESDDSSTEWLEEQDSEPIQEFWTDSSQPADDKPDWLKEMGGQQSSVDSDLARESGETDDHSVEGDEEEDLDWLQRIRTRHIADTGDEPEPEIDFPSAGADISEFAEEESYEEEILMQAEVEEPATPTRPDDMEIQSEAVEEAPDHEQPQEELTTEAPAAGETEIPDWMAGVVAGTVAAGVTAAEEPAEVDADLEGLPDWLSDLEKSSALDQDEIVPFGEEGGELTFDWLQAQVRADQDFPYGDLVESEAEATEAGVTGPFIGDLSDFLEDAELSSRDSIEAVEEKAGEDLAPADLPNWLEAMRPVEAAAAGVFVSDDKDAPLESSGPLAGLQGVLPAEPEIAQLKKPIAYALRLQVSDNQRAHADLFDDLVKSEGEPHVIPARPSVSSQYLFRLIIFLVLLLAIAWPIFTGSQVVPLPGLQPEVFDTSEIITDLPNNPLVLLAVDYEPGLAGELEATSSVVVDHLMLKGAYFALVSTTPNGPALAERLIADVGSRGGHSYLGVDQFANLGYLPGGVIGLQAFARAPRQVAPYALDPESTSVWGRAPMDQAQSLSDFDLVAVLSDDPVRVQAWIEQVQPTLDDTPMIALISSQAEPLVRPYYQAYPNQVQGMVVGVAGGGSYENAHQDLAARSGLASSYWDAFTLSMIAAVILIGVGGVINVIVRLLEEQKQSKLDGKS